MVLISSTNRSNFRSNNTSDYYVTPISEIELFLREFQKREPLDWANSLILDPCAGGNKEKSDSHGILDVYHGMSYPSAITNVFGTSMINTMDIRGDSLAEIKADYLSYNLSGEPDIIITNPPFNLALPIILKSMWDVCDGGYVIMLLRLNFFGSIERFPFFKEHCPKWCFVHHKRMGFVEQKDQNGYVIFNENGAVKLGGRDSIEYCHMVFQKGTHFDHTKLVVI